ncbi:MAG TPA: hypothetical protein VFA81_10915 [Burkholderiales bacterium]|nr:hypothetical protein [Burkholderiales bacterium]
MQKLDAPALAAALNALAETFDRKVIPAKALEMWFDTLREFPTESVLSLLHSWPKVHGKMPVPNEVWKALNERAIEEREQRNRTEKAKREREYSNVSATPEGERCLSEIYRIVTLPKPTPLEHWRKVVDTPGLPFISYEYAKEAITKLTRGRRTEPMEEAA